MQLPFVFDAHVDSILKTVDLGEDLAAVGCGHLDLARGRAGGLGAVVLAAWPEPVHSGPGEATGVPGSHGGAFRRAAALVEAGRDLARRRPDLARLCGRGEDLRAARREGRTGLWLGIEGGHAIECDLAKLEAFFGAGVRLLTLVWNNHLPWIRSCHELPEGLDHDVPAGLSDLGRQVVARMNELGMVVDLSHAAPAAFDDALAVASAPPLASHSGCAALHGHPRNLDDARLRRLADAGGAVGIVFHPAFLAAEALAADRAVYASDAYRAIGKTPGTREHAVGAARWVAKQVHHQREVAPFPLAGLVAHVLHALDVAGEDAVGLGSDFDGIPRTPAGLEDASCYPVLAEALAAAGVTPRVVDKVMGETLARLFDEVTARGRASEVDVEATLAEDPLPGGAAGRLESAGAAR